MSTAELNKHAGAETLLSKAPWTDEQGITMKIYQGVMITLEVLWLYIRMNLTWFHCIYRFFFPPEPKSVKGEIILITGAGHGMGREMALRFGRLGAVIVCVDINAGSNQQTVDLIKEQKGKAHRFECDVTDCAAVVALGESVRREVGHVTVLVNNAGIMPCKPLLQHSEQEVRAAFDVNAVAHLWLLQTFLPSMMEKNHGHVVAMSSMAGLMGLRNLVPYCATKWAVRGMMEAMHEELREDKTKDYSGIKFTVVCPFIIDTGLCKNPKIKFPGMLKILSPGYAAEKIVDAMRRDYYEITVPSPLIYVQQICRAFPREVSMHLKDYLDSGLEAQ